MFQKDRIFVFKYHSTNFNRTPPKDEQGWSRFTNVILTACWANGINKTPALTFTFNQEFRLDRKSTQRRVAQETYLKNICRDLKVDKNRLIYVGKEKNETREFVPESADLIRRWVETYKIDVKKTIVLSDAGTGFLENKENVFQKMGFKAHYQYFPVVHEYLSPNDNKLHGQAKVSWRHLNLDYKDDVKSTISLLNELDKCIPDTIRKYFNNNFFLRVENPTLEDSLQVIQRKPLLSNSFYVACLRDYKQFKKEKKISQESSGP